MADELTLHEAAAELGVHYMTVYRYVRLGLLAAYKDNGTWRIDRVDLRAFQEDGTAFGRPGAGRSWPDAPSVAHEAQAGARVSSARSDVQAKGDSSDDGVSDDGVSDDAGRSDGTSSDGTSGGRSSTAAQGQGGPVVVGPGLRPVGERRAPWAERLEARLVAGDAPGAWGVVEAALAAGAEPRNIHLDVISPAMAAIGDRWANGELDIAVEHRASSIATGIIGRLGPRFVRRGRSRGVVLLGAPAGERHALPIAIVADLVRSAGFEVHDLGADVPTTSFAKVAMTTGQLRAVGIGVTSHDCLGSVRATIEALREVAPLCPVLVGGLAVTSEAHAAELGADGFAANGRLVVPVIERLVAAAARRAAQG